ncbi:MAG: uncharacterized protein A8A55_2228 [Amphiamblys sp. WSBS2006]|nr:MAG: uncharacterized protein A8A55_2228 [Amphiamblys sp. WSBS2006]
MCLVSHRKRARFVPFFTGKKLYVAKRTCLFLIVSRRVKSEIVLHFIHSLIAGPSLSAGLDPGLAKVVRPMAWLEKISVCVWRVALRFLCLFVLFLSSASSPRRVCVDSPVLELTKARVFSRKVIKGPQGLAAMETIVNAETNHGRKVQMER